MTKGKTDVNFDFFFNFFLKFFFTGGIGDERQG